MLGKMRGLHSFPRDRCHLTQHCYHDLITLFDQTFYQGFNTRLIKGDQEPVYLPANNAVAYSQVVFAHGFYASALHEIAHWCIAGEQRRLIEDYGYWYCADGRNTEQQAQFELVEVKPQAIEWAFSVAAGKAFRVSTDNLNGAEPDRVEFEKRVLQQANLFLHKGFPARAQKFINALHDFYQTEPLTMQDFQTLKPGVLAVA